MFSPSLRSTAELALCLHTIDVLPRLGIDVRDLIWGNADDGAVGVMQPLDGILVMATKHMECVPQPSGGSILGTGIVFEWVEPDVIAYLGQDDQDLSIRQPFDDG